MKIEAKRTPGSKGQFDIVVDGNTIACRGGNWFTRGFGLGYPKFNEVVAEIEKLDSASQSSP